MRDWISATGEQEASRPRPTFVHQLGGKTLVGFHQRLVPVHLQEVREARDGHRQGAQRARPAVLRPRRRQDLGLHVIQCLVRKEERPKAAYEARRRLCEAGSPQPRGGAGSRVPGHAGPRPPEEALCICWATGRSRKPCLLNARHSRAAPWWWGAGGQWPVLRAGRRGDQHSVPRLPPLSVHAHVFTGGTLKPIPDNWHLTRVPESLLKHTDVFTKR